MRNVVDRSLWIGNAGDLRDVRVLLSTGIESVVEVSDSEPFVELPRDLVRCRFPLSDGGENPPWLVRLAVESVAAILRAKVPVIVCSSAGMNRSICIASGGIGLAEGRTLAESMKLVVGTGSADVSPGLFEQLRKMF